MSSYNFQLNGVLIRRDLYRLACLIASDQVLFDLAATTNDELLALRNEFVFDEITHLLISIAAANRIQFDFTMDTSPKRKNHALSDCGRLLDLNSGKEKPLTFREACNKIIHAVHIVPEAGGDPAHNPIGDHFILRGSLNEKSWQAFLHVGDYIRFSVANFGLEKQNNSSRNLL